MKYAIIGGTGVYSAGDGNTIEVKTEYGDVEVDVINFDDTEVAFISRHGKEHSIPPHMINYRANIMALYKLGVRNIFATVAVGSMNENFKPGDFVIANDFLDFTKVREHTFFTGGDKGVRHVEMSDPYCKNMRERFMELAKRRDIEIAGEGVYLTAEGPRFETAAEIRFMRQIGADIVGMTNVPEVTLSKELGICYSAVGIITNWCTGMTNIIESHDIDSVMSEKKDLLTGLFVDVFKEGLGQENCNCQDSLI
ncbi:MAG: S-methyl-5'-thioinosine phosphorylase [Tissierellia bacterium]|nr:S-methyl-5'-thioinosine phosphorylase [Tissierellia bacterium]